MNHNSTSLLLFLSIKSHGRSQNIHFPIPASEVHVQVLFTFCGKLRNREQPIFLASAQNEEPI